MVLASRPVLSASRLAARPVGAASATFDSLAASTLRIELTRVVLPTPGPPVTTSTLRAQRQAQRLPLARGQAEPGLLLDPGDRRLERRSPARAAALGQPQQPLGDAALGPVQAGQEHAGPALDRRRPPLAAPASSSASGLVHQLGRDLQQLGGERAQLVAGQAAVALVHGLGQREGDAGPGPDHRRLLDPQPLAIWSALLKPMPRMSRASR